MKPVAVADVNAEAVRTVLVSETFRRAERLRGLLSYLASRSGPDVTEADLARDVFGRPDYVPVEDSIVRVAVHQLRGKLREYYEKEGMGAAVRLEIPKGTYHLRYVPTAPEAAPRRRYPVVAVVALLAMSLALAIWVVAGRTAEKPGSGLAAFLGAPDLSGVTILLGDASYGFMQPYLAARPAIEDYLGRRLQLDPRLEEGEAPKAFFSEFRNSDWVSLSHMQASVTLLRGLPRDSRTVHARRFDARQLRNGNFVILGSHYSNPWASLFEDGMNFKFEERGRREFGFRNAAPQPQEHAWFGMTGAQGKPQMSHARIASLPIPSGSGRALLLAGLGTESTEAAADFVTLMSRHREFSELAGGKLPVNFELILETRVAAGMPLQSRVIAWRAH